MTHDDIIARWEARLAEWRQFKSQVDGAKVCEEVLEDFRAWQDAEENQLISLTDAARSSGYSREHLGRLVREGKIANHGSVQRPLVRRADLPTKPGHLPGSEEDDEFTTSSKRQIVRSVVAQGKGTR